MPLDNCSRCGRLFNKIGRDYCSQCYEEEEELLRETQAYLRDNKAAAKCDVLDALELEPWMLDKWIQDKRIAEFDESEQVNKRICMYCGREVKEGQTICRTCQLKKMSKSGGSSSGGGETKNIDDPLKKASRGMHFKPR